MTVRRCILAAAATKLVVLWASPGASSPACLSYDRDVTLRGVLIRTAFPGPPNYESVIQGDQEEIALVLKVGTPICVDADPKDTSGLSEAVNGVSEVQLVLQSSEWPPEGEKGNSVEVTGRLFGAISGHHRTPVLLELVHWRRVD